MRSLVLLAAVALTSSLAACTGATAPAPAPAEVETPAQTPAETPAEPATFGLVEVPRDGKQFNPPVHRDQIPDGAYYCDMGDVHYARITPGDGSCPVCGMELSHKESGEPATPE